MMSKNTIISTCGALAVAFATSACVNATAAGGANVATGNTFQQAERLDAFIEPFVEAGMFDGNVIVNIDGKNVYQRSFGYANYEFGVTSKLDTKYQIASVSKGITDAAIARMIDDGRFELSTRLSEFLPDFPSAEKITIDHLVNHKSGIAHTNRLPWGDGKTSLRLDEVIALLSELPLDFEPGTSSNYSNGGYAVLAKVLEIVSGESYEDALATYIFEPLGMEASGELVDVRLVREKMATGYEPGEKVGVRRHPRFYAAETKPGGGSLYSTAGDLVTFARAICFSPFLEQSTVDDALGMRDGVLLMQGRNPGFVSKVYCDQKNKVVVASVSNSFAVPSRWASTIAKIARGEDDSIPWQPITLSNRRLPDTLIGKFKNITFGNLESEIVRAEDGTLVAIHPYAEARYALVPVNEKSFLEPMYYQICEQSPVDRTFKCNSLAGDPRYNTEFIPVP